MDYHGTPEYNAFLIAVENSGAEVSVPFAEHTFSLGDAKITVLSPGTADKWDNKANYSIVLRVEFGTTAFLLPGDAMREVEANLLDSRLHLSSEVLKISRHGASSATTSGFLDAVNPSIAVVSAGENNSFLSPDTLRRLNNAGVHVFRTDLNGSISVRQISETDLENLNHSHENTLTLITCVQNQPSLRWSVRAQEINYTGSSDN